MRSDTTVIKKIKDEIALKLSQKIEALNLSNPEIVKQMSKQGISINAVTVSKLRHNAGSLTLDNIIRFYVGMGWNLEEILSPILNSHASEFPSNNTAFSYSENAFQNSQTDLFLQMSHEDTPLISSCNKNEIKQWYGPFYTYFFPTTESELGVLTGSLFIGSNMVADSSEDNSAPCEVTFELKTGKKNNFDHKPTVKHYFGTLILSPRTSSAHITLTWPSFGEITYLTFVDPVTASEGVKYAIGIALTMSSGKTRAPTAHRILISRKELTDQKLSFFKGQLYMNESDILISENAYQALLSDPRLPSSYSETFLAPSNPLHDSLFPKSEIYYRIKEDKINATNMSSNEKRLTLNLLREYSASRRYLKLGRVVGEEIHEMFQYFEKQEREQEVNTKDSSCSTSTHD